MRAHGVSSFPDPDGQGGIHLDASTHINPFSPSFRAAQARCHKLLPGGGPPAHVSEQQKERLVHVAECMRAHGVSEFPDPTTTPPTSPQNYSLIEGIGGLDGGLFLLIPKTIDVSSPAFKQAQNVCGFR
jgi:hypothetical protein